jgi:hypothetical protein
MAKLRVQAAGWLLAAALLSGASSARADIVRCVFTEPFITTVYNTNQSTLTIFHDVGNREDAPAFLSFQIIKPGFFELWNSKNEVVQRLQLSFRGSDGMSDQVYPYEVEWVPMKLHGGCTSNHLAKNRG